MKNAKNEKKTGKTIVLYLVCGGFLLLWVSRNALQLNKSGYLGAFSPERAETFCLI